MKLICIDSRYTVCKTLSFLVIGTRMVCGQQNMKKMEWADQLSFFFYVIRFKLLKE